MASPKIILITGANRGLGRGLLETYVQRPNIIVVAGVRNIKDASSQSLASVKTGSGSKVITVTINSNDDASAKKAVEVLKAEHGITKLDTVIANAGISDYFGTAVETPLSKVRSHFEVNVVGPLALFQATWPLLKLSSNPTFIGITSAIGSIAAMDNIPFPATAYGSSKAALNYIVRKVHIENPELTAFVIHPGWVQTEMGNSGAVAKGMEKAPVTVEDSIKGMVAKFDNATREKTSGTFQAFDDSQFPF